MFLDSRICFYYDLLAKDLSVLTHVEVGVWVGNSLLYLIKQTQNRNPPLRLFAVDLWDELKGDTNGEGLQLQSRQLYLEAIRKENCRDRIIDLQLASTQASFCFENKSVDSVFIDAAHDFESVYADICFWLPKIRKDGYLGGHDYSPNCGVKSAVDKMAGYMGLGIKHQGSVWWWRI